jgi:hypothetical protein
MWSPQRQEGDIKIVGPVYIVHYMPLDDSTPKMASTTYVFPSARLGPKASLSPRRFHALATQVRLPSQLTELFLNRSIR